MLLTWYFTRPRSGCLTDLQPLQQQQNSVNKANNTVAGKTNNSGKLGSPSSNDNTASPMDSASVTTPAVLTKEARGRVTRSSLGKAPLSLKSCEQVIWTLNIESYLFVFQFGLLLYNMMFFPSCKTSSTYRTESTGEKPQQQAPPRPQPRTKLSGGEVFQDQPATSTYIIANLKTPRSSLFATWTLLQGKRTWLVQSPAEAETNITHTKEDHSR